MLSLRLGLLTARRAARRKSSRRPFLFSAEVLEARCLLSGTGTASDALAQGIIVGFDPARVGLGRGDVLSFAADRGLLGGTIVSAGDVERQMPIAVRFGLDGGADLSSTIEELSILPNVVFVEPDYRVSIDLIPNDPRFGDLWGLHNTGQTGGTPDADIDAPEAWDIFTGSTGVVTGVIDTGVDYTHPDLYLNIWINQGEIPGGLKTSLSDVDADGTFTFVDLNAPANSSFVSDVNGTGYIDAGDLLASALWEDGLDTDGNGFVDDLSGWNFVTDTNDPYDDHSHGSHVSGTIAGRGNNSVGVAGVNWSAQVLPIKFLDSFGGGTTAGAIASVEYATGLRDAGVRLTSNSWGGGGFSTGLFNAIVAARDAGMLFVAAAGNNSSNNDSFPHYPSNYDSDNVIAVAATNHFDGRAGFSNYGPSTVDLGAPGQGILSTVPGGYATFDGTSMATPHVAGVAALAWGLNPSATYQEVRDAIFGGVDVIGSLSGLVATGGRLNAFKTLQNINPHQGTVALDRDEYTLPATIQITVRDFDLDLNPAAPDATSVEIRSTSESTPEIVTLTETGPSTRIFTGSIQVVPGPVVEGDNNLQAAHDDTITVIYHDAFDGTGPADVTDTATVDALPPDITSVNAVPQATSAAITWNTDEPADSLVRYGTDPANLNLLAADSLLATSHSLTLKNLTRLTTYYFVVESSDAAGNTAVDDNGGSLYQFTTLDSPAILFVDDDEGEALERFFTQALDEGGHDYETWTVNVQGPPTTADLAAYPIVVWNTGANYTAATAGLSAAEQTAIAGFLDGGGSIFLSGQDILYNGVSTSFLSNYLHLAGYSNDDGVFQAAGIVGDPIGNGTNLSIDLPPEFEFNYADTLLPDASAAGVFEPTITYFPPLYPFAASRYPAVDPAPFRLVFFAFPFEGISTSAADPNNQAAVMDRILRWLSPVPPAPTLSIDDVSVTEGDSGTLVAAFTVSLSQPLSQDVTVDFATSNGSATAGSDYTAASGTLTIPAGTTSGPINVLVHGDTQVEPDETFVVTLSNASGAVIGDAQGTGTILNDDVPPELSIGDVTVTEGNAGTTTAAFSVTLSFAIDQDVTVDFATSNQSATAGADYTAASGTLTIPAGETTGTIEVGVLGDVLDEDNETFLVTLSNPSNATIADGQGIGTITDDDLPPALLIDDVTVTEGDSGTVQAVFTVALSAPSGRTVSVTYATADGTANAPGDYGAIPPTTFTFNPGQMSRTISVLVTGDTLDESDEYYLVNLSNPVNATISDGQGQGTIIDDDEPTPPGGSGLFPGVVSGVTNTQWTTVTLPGAYDSMVVVATPNYDSSLPPLVTRIRNAGGSSFEIRLDRADGSAAPIAGIDVHYVVANEGVYNDGTLKMEAVKFDSSRTDRRGSWVGDSRSYGNTYVSPVVVGQVMTANDPDWSVFWSRSGSSKNNPPNGTLRVGKHVGEDSDISRSVETIGYLVFETGSGTTEDGTFGYVAALGSDTVRGVGNAPPYSYPLTASFPQMVGAVASQSAMDGNDGSWAVLYGANPLTTSTIKLAVDEDRMRDFERSHSTEQVAWVAFGGFGKIIPLPPPDGFGSAGFDGAFPVGDRWPAGSDSANGRLGADRNDVMPPQRVRRGEAAFVFNLGSGTDNPFELSAGSDSAETGQRSQFFVVRVPGPDRIAGPDDSSPEDSGTPAAFESLLDEPDTSRRLDTCDDDAREALFLLDPGFALDLENSPGIGGRKA